jgi:DNA-binding SARP family transcriptional activator
MPPTLSIRLLGDFSLIYGDEPVAGINTPRLHSLFAYLVLHRDAPQLRQHLAFLFWPDSSEAQARTNLRQILHQLRHALPDADHFLYADANAVYWHPDATFQLDVAEFEQALASADAAIHDDDQRAALEQAAQLYRADLLLSCYDEWIAPERERLHLRHQQALAQLIGLLEARRDYAAATRHAQRLLRDDPLDEAVYRDLMRLLALNNDRAGALHIYHSCVATLRRELGVEPSQPTREAYESLLHRESLGPPAARRQHMREAAPPLVNRQREWEQLHAAWRRACAGEPGFALVTGEAGIGKSRLAEELLAWAYKQGISVAKTRSYAAEGQLSLAPVTDWLRSESLRPHLAQLDTLWLSEVSRILPELIAAQADLPPYEPVAEYGQRQRFFEALTRAVLAAPQPLLLLIDDLQWCDQETIEWLHFLLRFDPHARLLVVGTARAEEVPPQHPLRALLLHLRSTLHATEVALQPLDAAETVRLAAHIAGRELDTESAMRIYRETEGNPLFVVETMRAGFDSLAFRLSSVELGGAPSDQLNTPTSELLSQSSRLPPRVHAVIAGRLAELSPPARELAGLAAAVGHAFSLDLLLQAGQTSEDSAVRALDELWQKRIVREQGANSYDFTHDKLREVAYAEISAPQRWLLHRRIAQVLEQTNADDLAPISGQIASQYERAGMAEQAIPHYQRAATVAQRLYANEDAINLLSRGLALLEQLPPGTTHDAQELKMQLALAPLYRMIKGWTSPEVEGVLARAMALCDTGGDDTQRTQVCYGLQSLYVVQAKLEKVQLVSDELHQLYQRTHGTSPPLVAEMMLTGSRLHLGRLTEASAEFEQMIATHDPTQLQRIVE